MAHKLMTFFTAASTFTFNHATPNFHTVISLTYGEDPGIEFPISSSMRMSAAKMMKVEAMCLVASPCTF